MALTDACVQLPVNMLLSGRCFHRIVMFYYLFHTLCHGNMQILCRAYMCWCNRQQLYEDPKAVKDSGPGRKEGLYAECGLF